MRGRKVLQEIEDELGQEWRDYHVAAQLTRLGIGFLTTLGWSMHAGATDWTDIVPLAVTAAWTALEQVWPRVPWKLIRNRGHLTAPAPPVPPGEG